MHDAFALPGFRRRFLIEPSLGRVRAALEDDYHCMRVEIAHADGIVQAIEPAIERAPWTTCPGAVAQLRATFQGATLGEAARLGENKRNCTHLYDLAMLCAAHAGDGEATQYEIAVSDPEDGRSVAALRRNETLLLHWELDRDALTAPAALAGKALFALRDWIGELPAPLHEPARLLQWAAILAQGRQIPMHRQNNASRMPANCYTFQPENAIKAVRVGEVLEFSRGRGAPLDHYRGGAFLSRDKQSAGELP